MSRRDRPVTPAHVPGWWVVVRRAAPLRRTAPAGLRALPRECDGTAGPVERVVVASARHSRAVRIAAAMNGRVDRGRRYQRVRINQVLVASSGGGTTKRTLSKCRVQNISLRFWISWLGLDFTVSQWSICAPISKRTEYQNR